MEDNILDLGKFKLKKKDTYSRDGKCRHRNLIADEVGETIICEDCGLQVSSFWALMKYCRNVKKYKEDLNRRSKRLKELEDKTVTLKAALAVEKAWRRRNSVPTCPHCHEGILPTDGFGGASRSKDYEMEVRKFKNKELK
jgi:hypothetical protein